MNNNDILNELLNGSESFNPSDKLNPMAIEESLNGVKRKNNKALTGVFASLAVVCLTLTSLFGSAVFVKVTDPSTEELSYKKIYEVVDTIKKENETQNYWIDNIEESIDYFGTTAESTTTNGAFSDNSYSASTDYSDTNIQVQGVDEADVVKTDGEYIYSLKNNSISITRANNGNPEFISSIDIGQPVSELYISNNKLVAIVNYYTIPETETADTAIIEEFYDNNFTAVLTYDLSDIYSPKKISTLTQSGCYVSSRKIGDVVYLTTSYYIYSFEHIEEEKPQTYCPVYGNNEEFTCVDADCIIISENTNSLEYLTVSAINLNSPTDFADMRSVLGEGSEMYSSQDNLYIASSFYDNNRRSTQILRFSLNETEIIPNGSTIVSGSILNQFSMDEYNGYFRIVTETDYFNYSGYYWNHITSTSDVQTALYVYDSDLNLVGKTENVADGEHVKSVRFDGDIAYFVTFRQTDPLFTVDLSDPTSPQILSELKIPGFSEYLHVFGDGLLLGFGREADEISGSMEGLKLTMFDTSDKTNVTEIATRTISTSYSYSDAEYDHKAIFVDEENSLIGIPYTDYSSTDGNLYKYAVYKYDKENKDFILRTEMTLSSTDFNQYYSDDYSRGLYIGDYFYIVTQDTVYAYDYATLEQTGVLYK